MSPARYLSIKNTARLRFNITLQRKDFLGALSTNFMEKSQ